MSAKDFLANLPVIAPKATPHRVAMHLIMLDSSEEAMLRRGFKYVDAGYYSSVYEHRTCPGVVFKVSNPHGFTYRPNCIGEYRRAELDGYARYIAWCGEYSAEYGALPIMPKVLACVSRADKQVYVLERLTPLAGRSAELPKEAESIRLLLIGREYLPMECKNTEHFLLWLLDKIDEAQVNVDLHPGNIMWRKSEGKSDVLVVTDPIGGGIRHGTMPIMRRMRKAANA